MKIKVILNKGLKTCCKTYPSDMVRNAMNSWFKEDKDTEIEVIETNIQLEPLASLAEQHFGDRIYPLIYINDKLVAIGTLPDFQTLHDMIENVDTIGISEQDILDAVEKFKKENAV